MGALRSTFDLLKSETKPRDCPLVADWGTGYKPLLMAADENKAAEKKYLFIVRYFTKVDNQYICRTKTQPPERRLPHVGHEQKG